MAAKPHHSPALKRRVREFFNQGLSNKTIKERQDGLNDSTLKRWRREWKVDKSASESK